MELILFLVSLVFLTRMALIIAGLLKEPILRSFLKYGYPETFYYPLPQLLLWMGCFIISIGIWLAPYSRAGVSVFWLGVLLLLGKYAADRFSAIAQQHPEKYIVYPRWYADLRERTTRLERRRLAYMWLHLPWRARLMYNSSDRAFLIWADLVILGTIRVEDDEEEMLKTLYSNPYDDFR